MPAQICEVPDFGIAVSGDDHHSRDCMPRFQMIHETPRAVPWSVAEPEQGCKGAIDKHDAFESGSRGRQADSALPEFIPARDPHIMVADQPF